MACRVTRSGLPGPICGARLHDLPATLNQSPRSPAEDARPDRKAFYDIERDHQRKLRTPDIAARQKLEWPSQRSPGPRRWSEQHNSWAFPGKSECWLKRFAYAV